MTQYTVKKRNGQYVTAEDFKLMLRTGKNSAGVPLTAEQKAFLVEELAAMHAGSGES